MPLSTLAAKSSPDGQMSSRNLTILANVDLIALAAALPVFIGLGLPLSAYAVAAGLWVASRLLHRFAESRAQENLLLGKRNTAMGAVAASSLGSAWIMALGVLISGVIDRETGLYSAILLVVLFTLNLASRGIVHLLKADQEPEA